MVHHKDLLSRLGVLATALTGAAVGLCFGVLVAAAFENAVAQWDAAGRAALAQAGGADAADRAGRGSPAPWVGVVFHVVPPLLGAGASLGLLGWVHRAGRQRRVVAAIRALGGHAVYGEGILSRQWHESFVADYFASVVSVHLDGTAIGDTDLAWLRFLPRVRRLWLADTSITDAALAQVSKLRRLESLDLSGTAVTDAGLAALGRMKCLRRLWLLKTQVTPAGIEALQQLPRLGLVELGPQSAATAGVGA